MPRPATWRCMPMPSAARPTTTASRAIPICSMPDAALQRPAAELARAHRTAVRRRLLYLDEGFVGARHHAEQRALRHSRHRWRGPQHAHRRARDEGHQQGRIPPAGRWHRCGALLVGAPTTSTTSSGSPTRPTPSPTACARPSPTRSRKAASRCSCCPFDLRFATLTTALGRAGRASRSLTAPGDDAGAVQRPVRPERQQARRRIHLQRVQVLGLDQGADRGPHRACEAQRHDA